MLEKTHYVNGQRIWVLNGDRLTFYYKSGKLKAAGGYSDGKMQGEWKFYREDGSLSQTGHLKDDLKDGRWVRYGDDGQAVYDETFIAGKAVKK